MKVAIIGTGISGNVAAFKLREQHDITVFEAADYVGGHTHTVEVDDGDAILPIDTGFIVFNDRTYPNFVALLEEIGQPSQESEMSFGVHSESGSIEYCGTSLNALFAQRLNLVRPSFFRMVRDILRFNREAPADIAASNRGLTLLCYLTEKKYSDEFIDHYLLPMVAAIWSAKPLAALQMPAAFLLRFFANHGLLQLEDRPQWRVIQGGSQAYVQRLVEGHRERIRLNATVRSLSRLDEGVEIVTDDYGKEQFDCVFVSCHSDQALRMLADPSAVEKQVLGAIAYQNNEAVLHTDVSVLPRRRRAWAAWNYFVPDAGQNRVAVTYNMNILQRIESENTYCVTLNDSARIDSDKVIRRVQYQHPVFSQASIAAQARQSELNSERTFYCGAYWGNGFHEDGVVSALQAITHFEEGLGHAELHLRRVG